MSEWNEIEVENRQTLEDIAVQEYGAIEGIEQLLLDNQDRLPEGLGTGLWGGMLLLIRKDEPVDEKQLADIKKKGIKPATGVLNVPPPVGPDYNDDYNEDHNI